MNAPQQGSTRFAAHHRATSFIVTAVLFLLSTALILAQATTALQGTVADAKGGMIPHAAISIRNETTGRTVDNVLVPPGATWDTGGTTSFDPTQVQRHGEPYAPAPR